MKPPTVDARQDVRLAAASSVVGAGGTLVFLFASGILNARALGPTDRGLFALVTLTPSVLVQICGLGTSLSLTHHVASDRIGAIDALRVLRRPIALQLLAVAVGSLVVGSLVVADDPSDARLAAVVIVIVAITSTSRDYAFAVLQGCHRNVAANFLRVMPALLWSAGIGAVYVLRPGSLLAAISAMVVAECLSAASVCIAARRAALQDAQRAPEPTVDRSELLRFGRASFRSYLSPLDGFQLDQAYIGLAHSAKDLGFYAAGSAFTLIPRVIAQNVGMSAAPLVAAARVRGASPRAVATLFVGITLGVTICIAVGLAISASWLIPALYGEPFRPAVPVCEVLLAAGVILGARRIFTDVLRGAGRPAGIWPDALSLVTFFVGAPVGWAALGLVGVAWAFVAAASINLIAIVLLHRLKRRSLVLPDGERL